MKQVLKDLLDSKKKLLDMQEFFTKTFEDRYPNLLKEDTSKLEKKLNSEIEFLLSSTLRIKSGRIVIPSPDFGWKKELVLTRNPGLKCPYEAYSALDLTAVGEIRKNGDLVKRIFDQREKLPVIKTSILRESEIILQDKLEDFYKFLKKIIDWKVLEIALIDSRYARNEPILKVEKSKIRIFSEDFELLIFNPTASEKENRFDNIMSTEIIEYSREGDWGRKSSLENQEVLLRFWHDFELFDKALMSAEKSKKDLMKKGMSILGELVKYNKPVRLLNKLMQN